MKENEADVTDCIGDAVRVLHVAADAISPAQAVVAMRHHYGLEATATPLHSERDRNFLIALEGEPRYVLRFANPAEQAKVVDFRLSALLYVERHAPHLPVPRVLPTVEARNGFTSSGAGGTSLGHVNDAGFWLVKEYLGMTVGQTLRTWTVMKALMGVTGIAILLVVNSL